MKDETKTLIDTHADTMARLQKRREELERELAEVCSILGGKGAAWSTVSGGKLGGLRDSIVRFVLECNRPVTRKEMAQAFPEAANPGAGLDITLSRLVKSGKLLRVRHGTYQISLRTPDEPSDPAQGEG